MYKTCREILDKLERGGTRINHNFNFPARRPLTKHLKDVLEVEVDEKYYLSDEQTKGLKFSNPDVAYCLDANYYKGTNVSQYLQKRRRQIIKVGDLDIKGNDQIKRVYGTGGGITNIINNDGGQSPTENNSKQRAWYE